jgi:transposase
MTDAVLKEDVAVVQQAVCPDGTAVDCARKVLRALLLQVFYTVRSERLFYGRIELQPVVPLVVGLSIDDPVWNASTFSKNRDRLLKKRRRTGFSRKC